MMKLVFGIYMMVTLIVLINLLIAMMSDTYQRIQVHFIMLASLFLKSISLTFFFAPF